MNLIFELIPKIMAEIGAIGKNQKNKDQGYNFRGIEDMYNAAHHVMTKYGVFCCPEVVGNEIESFERDGSSGRKVIWHHATLKVRHRFYAPDASYVDVITMGEGLDNSDKAINKAMSGAMKYAFIELFSVPTKDIEDADRTTPEATRTIVLEKPNGKTIEMSTLVSPEEIPALILPEAEVQVSGNDTTDIPDDAEPPVYIKKGQSIFLARRFRESLKKDAQSKDDEYRHAALIALDRLKKFKSKLVVDGRPTSDYILKSEFTAIGTELINAAKNV